MATLFEIGADFLRLQEMAEDPEIDQEAIKDTFEAIEGEFNEKVESWLKVIRNLQEDTLARERMMDDLEKKNEADLRTIDRMKGTLKQIMEATGLKKAGGAVLSATVCGVGGKKPLVWADGIKEDARLLPQKYQKVETVYKADTEAIRADLDAGIEVPGVEYGDRGTYLKVK
jgi:predicted DNA-binding protein YlxM (UPF0122 family)